MMAEEDHETYLRVLGIFYYVMAALAAIIGCLPVFHVVLGLAMTFGLVAEGAGPPTWFGITLALLGLFFIVLTWALAALLAGAGYFLPRRRRWTFCLVVAALACFLVPPGTILGVLTIVVLIKPEVREEFGAA